MLKAISSRKLTSIRLFQTVKEHTKATRIIKTISNNYTELLFRGSVLIRCQQPHRTPHPHPQPPLSLPAQVGPVTETEHAEGQTQPLPPDPRGASLLHSAAGASGVGLMRRWYSRGTAGWSTAEWCGPHQRQREEEGGGDPALAYQSWSRGGPRHAAVKAPARHPLVGCDMRNYGPRAQNRSNARPQIHTHTHTFNISHTQIRKDRPYEVLHTCLIPILVIRRQTLWRWR